MLVAALVATALLLSQSGSRAAVLGPGELDPTFGDGGKIVGLGGSAIAVQPDGKIVVAQTFASWISMEFAVTRLLPDGTLDATFASGSDWGPGVVVTDFSGRDDYVGSVMLLPDGTIVVGGAADCSPYGQYECGFGLAFYSPDGTELGKGTTFFSTSAGVNSLALQNGRIVAAGGPYLVRYDGGGVLEVTTKMAWILTVLVQPDGKLVASGWCHNDLGTSTSCIARFGADDSLDTTFGVNGLVTDETVFLGALTLQPDGKLVAVGAGSGDFVLVRYNPDGSLDTSFGAEGKVSTDFGNHDRASAVALQPDGKIIAAGATATPALDTSQFALARYDAGGSLDSTFGSLGKVTTEFHYSGYSVWYATAIIVEPDGRLIEAGFGEWPGVYGALPMPAMARYLPGADQQSPLASLSMAPTSVVSGDAATGTVTLTAAQTSDVSIALSTSDTALATVPPSVTVPAGSTSGTFDVSTTPVFTTTGVEIRASLGDATRYASLLLYAQTSVRDVLIEPSVVGGNPAAGTLYLTRAPGSTEAVEVMLTSSHPAVASVPLSVTMDGTSATFPIHTTVVDTATPVTISATYRTTAAGGITVNPPPSLLASLTLNPPSVTAGTSSMATVTLTSAAPAGGASISLSSVQQAAGLATLPSGVTVPQGATSADFTVFTSTCTSGSAAISAMYGGVTQSAGLTVTSAADIVTIQRAQYVRSKRELRVEATSTSSTATLEVLVTSSGALLGRLTNVGGGSYTGLFAWPVNPISITVRSTACGSATSQVVLR